MPADHQSRPPFSISTTQIMSGALAAVTAAVVGSRLGIAGTLIGAGAGSVIATIGTAMYGHWLDRTATRVRTVVRIPAPSVNRTATSTATLDTVDAVNVTRLPAETAGVRSASTLPQPTWRTVGLAAVATFAVAIGSITAFEAITGEPVATLTGGDSGAGTTLGRAVDSGPASTIVEPDPAPTVTPTDPATETPTPTPTPTDTSTPTDPPTTPPTTPPPTSTQPTTPPPPPT